MTRSDAYGDEVVRQFPKLWRDIGCLKDMQVNLHINNSVPPVAQKHRREKVTKEITKLEAVDIIEKIFGPTELVLRIVKPPKPEKLDEMRLCINMREANKAIL